MCIAVNEHAPTPLWLSPIERLVKAGPLYVAYPLAVFLDDYAQDPRSARPALFSLCESVEAVVRFLAITRGVEIIGPGTAPEWLAKAAADNLLVPTFGKWMNLLRVIGEHEKKGRSVLLPELAEAAATFDNELFAKPSPGGQPELHNLLAVRNPIAHGSGISATYAQALLAHWGPKVAAVFGRLGWLSEIELWTRDDPNGFKHMTGPDANGKAEEAPRVIKDALSMVGGVALRGADHVVMIHPLGRRAPHRDADRHLAQIFVRQGETGLVYSLFGADDALQSESGFDELDRLERMFDIESIRSAQRNASFQQRDYDGEFARDAANFVGREEALDILWQAVVDRPHGVVFVSAPAGIGKSSLVARVAADLGAEVAERAARERSNELLLAYRFIDRDRGCAPLPFLMWLIERLAAAKDTSVKAGSDQTIDALRETALQLLRDCGRDRVILVLDGLDEMARREQRFITDFVGRLAAVDRLLLLASSRPERGIPEAMAAAGASEPWPGGLPGMSPAELRAMLVSLLPRAARKLVGDDKADGRIRNRFIEALVARADGLPLYVALVVQATHQKDFTLDKLADPSWLPKGVEDFFDRIVLGWASDRVRTAPLVGCLLALARTPLSSDEIAALITRDITLEQSKLMRQRYNVDSVDQRRKITDQVLRSLGGLLRASIGIDLQRRFRLLHDNLREYLLRSEGIAYTMIEAQTLLAKQAMKPGDDAASAYLFRNGITHIIEGDPDPKRGAEEAARLLSCFDYQVQRLASVATMGGDGGIREDWTRIQRETIITKEVPRAWRHFWGTDGTLFEPGEGRDAARELLERVLEYAPDTIVGSSYGLPSAQ
jgi:hypothetical protein